MREGTLVILIMALGFAGVEFSIPFILANILLGWLLLLISCLTISTCLLWLAVMSDVQPEPQTEICW